MCSQSTGHTVNQVLGMNTLRDLQICITALIRLSICLLLLLLIALCEKDGTATPLTESCISQTAANFYAHVNVLTQQVI